MFYRPPVDMKGVLITHCFYRCMPGIEWGVKEEFGSVILILVSGNQSISDLEHKVSGT